VNKASKLTGKSFLVFYGNIFVISRG